MNWKLFILIGLGLFIIIAGFFLVGGEVGGVNLETITAKVLVMSGGNFVEGSTGNELDDGTSLNDGIEQTKNETAKEYPDNLTEKIEQKYFGDLVVKYNGIIGKSPEQATKTWYPDGSIDFGSAELILETEINNISIRGTAKVGKYFSGKFYVNTSSDDIFVFLDAKSKPIVTLTTSTLYTTTTKEIIEEKFNETSGKMDTTLYKIPVKNYTGYIALTRRRIAEIRTALGNEFFIDPIVSACGNMASAGTYTLDRSISSTTTCMSALNSANDLILDCAGFTINFNSAGGSNYNGVNYATATKRSVVKNCYFTTNTSTGIGIVAIRMTGATKVNISVYNNTFNLNSTGTGTRSACFIASGVNSSFYNNNVIIYTETQGSFGITSGLNSQIYNNVFNIITTNNNNYGITIGSTGGSIYNNTLNNRWVSVQSGVSGSISNTTFNNSNGSINFPNSIAMTSAQELRTTSLIINNNFTYLNATKFPAFNTTATITLNGLTLTGTPTIGINETDTQTPIGFSNCSGCSLTSYAGGIGIFSVPNFGFSYALQGTASPPSNCWTRTGSGTGSILSIPTGCLYQVNSGVVDG